MFYYVRLEIKSILSFYLFIRNNWDNEDADNARSRQQSPGVASSARSRLQSPAVASSRQDEEVLSWIFKFEYLFILYFLPSNLLVYIVILLIILHVACTNSLQ